MTVAILVAASGCASQGIGDASPQPGIEGECDAARAQSLIGREASEALGAEAMRLSGAERLRWIPEGSAVTMDYIASRLNILLDRQNKVVKVDCG